VRLVNSESYDSAAAAAKRERQLKRWRHAKKEALVSSKKEELKSISKRRW
jgi:predicted GIY-YIG superfamily endonuclease